MELDWLNINPMEGNTGQTEVYASVSDNTTIGVTRYADVRFTNDAGLSEILKITQSANTEGLMFNVSPYVLQYASTGGTLTGTVISNSKWFVTDYPDWLIITTDNQDGSGEGVLTITAVNNTGATERSGNIEVTSFGEVKTIYVLQAGYSTLSVSPQELLFRRTTGTSSVTIVSSAVWSVNDYDREHIEVSQETGPSGTTVISVSLKSLPPYVSKYGVNFLREVVFTDNVTEKVVSIQYVGSQNIDDKYITVTYNIPTPGTYLAYKYVRCSGCSNWAASAVDADTIWAKQEIHTEQLAPTDWEGWPCYELVYVYYYFGTAGLHTIKYFSNYYGIGQAAFHRVGNIQSIVIGDRNNGVINPWAIAETKTSLVFGAGTHTITTNSNNPYVFNQVTFGTSLYIPPTLVYGALGFRQSNANTLVYDHTRSYAGGVFANTIVFTERFNSACTITGGLNTTRLQKIVFISDTAPSLDTTIGHNITVYYPRNGTGYTTRWNNQYVTLVPYDSIDDIPV